MPLDPLVRRWLDDTYGQPFTPMDEMTPQQARRQMSAASELLGPGEAVAAVEELIADGPGGPIPVRLYRPRIDEAAAPVVVYFHGGGWVVGGIDSHDAYCRELANASGWAVASVEYRLAPEHRFPAAFDDSYAAAIWIAKRAGELNLDARRIAVGGDSAGGNLAAAVALAARDRNGPMIAAQILIYPITDHALETPSYRANAEGFHLTQATMRWFWDLYVPDAAARDHRFAAPLRAETLADLPRALVQTAEFDPLLNEGEAYARRLEQAGVPTRLTRYDGMIHGFVRRTREWPAARAAMSEVAAFLNSGTT